jgi:hypothetical protein
MSGFGRERGILLRVRGAEIEHATFWVVTRPAPIPGLKGGNGGTYSARFDHLAGPTKPIVGTVRDKQTGKALAGIRVVGNGVEAITDEQGHYRLVGGPKQAQYEVTAGGRKGLPYFDRSKRDIPE